MTPLHLSHPKYRPEIDGLRAIAVLSVVAFHALPDWVKGGFIGVDIFFVISGFLISTIIFENLDNGTFTFSGFYARRIKRIFPALLFVLVASFTFGWFMMLADEFKQLGKHIAAGVGFYSNFTLWHEAGYFDKSGETKPLLHLWSLGIEEQFYILWPLLLWVAWKRKFDALTVIVVVALGSFLLNIDGIKKDAVGAYYSPQSRFWELLSGSLLAWLSIYNLNGCQEAKATIERKLASILHRNAPDTDGSNTLANISVGAGLLLLAYGFFCFNKDMNFPGKRAAVPVVAAMLIISAGHKAWFNRRVLANPLVVWFGLISFPLYLWHWPLLTFARIIEGDVPRLSIRLTAVTLSIALAWLTYRFLERNIRTDGNNRTKIITLVVLMLLVGSAGYITDHKDGFGFRVENFSRISSAAGEWEYPGRLETKTINQVNYYELNSRSNSYTLFIGDSNIEQYYSRIDELIKQHPDTVNSAIFKTEGGCLAVPDLDLVDRWQHCSSLAKDAAYIINNVKNIKTVVFGQYWPGHLQKGFGRQNYAGLGSKDYINTLNKLESFIAKIRSMGIDVYIVLTTPSGKDFDPKNMVKRGFAYYPDFIKKSDVIISRTSIEKQYELIHNDLRNLALRTGSKIINPLDYLCDGSTCPASDVMGNPMYKDANHLRPSYVRKNINYIDQTMN